MQILQSQNLKLHRLIKTSFFSILLIVLMLLASISNHPDSKIKVAKISTPISNKNELKEIENIKPLIIEESGSIDRSRNTQWWLNSGGLAYIEQNHIKTIQGDLSDDDPWRIKYDKSNPAETDNGYHPQNIFRLVTRQKYDNPTQSMYFKINKYILSKDVHRSASNGVLFFHHYQDGNNLYYAGLRVDGYAVIKKKTNGQYFTMAYEPMFTESKYNRETNPNLLPVDKFIGIKTEIQKSDSKIITLKLYVDFDESGIWKLAAEAIDNGQIYGGDAITKSGYAGIRTDFMDIEFKDYKIE